MTQQTNPMTDLSIGDRVWYARVRHEPVERQCPVCFGNLEVTVIMGNGEHVVTPCDCCGVGWNGPSGIVSEYDYIVEARQITIAEVRTVAKSDGATHEYLGSDGRFLDLENMHDTEAAAAAHADDMAKEMIERQQNQRAYRSASARKRMTWSIDYHRKRAADYQRQADYHRDRVTAIKARNEKKKGG